MKRLKKYFLIIMAVVVILAYGHRVYSVNKEYKNKYLVEDVLVKNNSVTQISKYKCLVSEASLYKGKIMKKFVEDNKNKFALLNPSEYDEDFDIVGILYVKMRGVEGIKSKLVLKVGQVAKESPISNTGEFCYELTGQEIDILKEKGVMLGDYAYLFGDGYDSGKENSYFGFYEGNKRFIFKLDPDFVYEVR
nr:hypothetical protein [uncultured Peptostreptococcus sp.]